MHTDRTSPAAARGETNVRSGLQEKLRAEPQPLPSSQQSAPSADRIGQDELIHKTAA